MPDLEQAALATAPATAPAHLALSAAHLPWLHLPWLHRPWLHLRPSAHREQALLKATLKPTHTPTWLPLPWLHLPRLQALLKATLKVSRSEAYTIELDAAKAAAGRDAFAKAPYQRTFHRTLTRTRTLTLTLTLTLALTLTRRSTSAYSTC